MAIAMAPSMFTNLVARMNRKHQIGKISTRSNLPPEVMSNMPQVDRVDIRAMLKKWED